MASIPLLIKDELERLGASIQIDSLSGSPVNQAFTAVAQEVVALLKQAQPFQTDRIHCTEMVMIRAIDPEAKDVMAVEPLTARELEVLQLIVDRHNNPTIAGKLHLTMGTVKTHVRNILKKFYVNDRTQTAIRALRSGLVH